MQTLRPACLLLSGVALIALVALAPARLQALPLPGQTAPGFRLVTTAGQRVSQENYRGHVLVMDFFATWCRPCRSAIPHLILMNRKFGSQGLQILGVSADEDGEPVLRAFAEELRINYPVALAGDTVMTDFGVRSVPVMVVIDRHGRIAQVFRGFNDEIGSTLEQLVKRLLAEK
jgi:peroxiredoxin